MSLQAYQQRFLELTVDAGVLQLGGEFKLKSGRVSPYFFNAGLFSTGLALQGIGEAFAEAILASGIEFDMLFGPAYKGIPLVAAVAIALATKHNRNVPFAYNRKEAKDHGEGGVVVGAPLKGRVLLIDDVITAGTAIRESVALLGRFAECELAAVAVALDRQERAPDSSMSAIQSVEKEYNLKVVSIATLDTILAFVKSSADPAVFSHLKAYRDLYGVEAAPGQ